LSIVCAGVPKCRRKKFYSYWLDTHGPKVKDAAEALRARRYVQSHTCEAELNVIDFSRSCVFMTTEHLIFDRE
jgi:EthD domain